MLEAEVAELAGTADTPLAEHIRDCPRCGAVAERLLVAQDELAAALDRTKPGVPVKEALRRARVAPAGGDGVGAWLAGGAAAGLAAAAILAVLLLTGPEPPEGEPWVGGDGIALVEPEEPAPAVEAPGDRNVMVLDTGNPKVRIVWVY